MWQRMETARLQLGRYEREGERFRKRIIPLDETWVLYYEPKLMRQSNVCRYNDYSRPNMYRQEQYTFKVVFSAAYDFDGLLVTHSVPA